MQWVRVGLPLDVVDDELVVWFVDLHLYCTQRQDGLGPVDQTITLDLLYSRSEFSNLYKFQFLCVTSHAMSTFDAKTWWPVFSHQ